MNMLLKLQHNKPEVAAEYYDTSMMKLLVEELSFPRTMFSSGGQKAKKLVIEQFKHIFGQDPVVVGESQNIVAGNYHKAKIFVGAHYDSVAETMGADDNASAVAVMFDIASKIGLANDEVCYIAFNGEECGLVGSKEFADTLWCVHKKNKHVKQVHVLEMVGYRSFEPNSQQNPVGGLVSNVPTVGDFIGAVSLTPKLMDLIMEQAKESDIPVVGLGIPPLMGASLAAIKKFAPHLLRSDHAHFWEEGFPAVMWTDTAEFRNQNYHTMNDTPDTLDYAFMGSVSRLIQSVIKAELGI